MKLARKLLLRHLEVFAGGAGKYHLVDRFAVVFFHGADVQAGFQLFAPAQKFAVGTGGHPAAQKRLEALVHIAAHLALDGAEHTVLGKAVQHLVLLGGGHGAVVEDLILVLDVAAAAADDAVEGIFQQGAEHPVVPPGAEHHLVACLLCPLDGVESRGGRSVLAGFGQCAVNVQKDQFSIHFHPSVSQIKWYRFHICYHTSTVQTVWQALSRWQID